MAAPSFFEGWIPECGSLEILLPISLGTQSLFRLRLPSRLFWWRQRWASRPALSFKARESVAGLVEKRSQFFIVHVTLGTHSHLPGDLPAIIEFDFTFSDFFFQFLDFRGAASVTQIVIGGCESRALTGTVGMASTLFRPACATRSHFRH